MINSPIILLAKWGSCIPIYVNFILEYVFIEELLSNCSINYYNFSIKSMHFIRKSATTVNFDSLNQGFLKMSLSDNKVVCYSLQFLPLPMISGFYLARFFTKKSLSSYFAFVTLASLMVLWFVMHNYWDLSIWMAGMSLKSFCKYIVASIILAMAVPGLALLPPKLHFLTELGLICHALLLCYIEDRFFNYSTIYFFGFDDEVMYPSYMVLITTFLGLALLRRLYVDRRIGPKAVWILTCLYFSKLSMLFMTSKSVLWASAVLLLAVSPPLLLYKYGLVHYSYLYLVYLINHQLGCTYEFFLKHLFVCFAYV